LACPASGIDIFSASLLSGAIGLATELSTAVGAADVVVSELAAGGVFTGVESLPGAGGDSGDGVASLAGVPGAVVESMGAFIAGGWGDVVSAVRSFGGGASLHAARAKAQQIAIASGCRAVMTNLHE
jgi:hypothetical protein